jgi:hypothetical protein
MRKIPSKSDLNMDHNSRTSFRKQLQVGKLILILSFIGCRVAFSQSYIKTDSVIETGLQFEWENREQHAQIIRQKKNDEIKQYTAADITEYGLKDGRVYRSLSIVPNGTKYFFQLLSTGKYNVYYLPASFLGDQYYIASDNNPTLTPLPGSRKLLRSALSEYVKGCGQALKNSRHVRKTNASLGRFFNDYEKCAQSYLPRPHIGLTFGVTFVKFKPREALPPVSSAKISRMNEISFGVFAEYPIRKSNISVATHPTIYNYNRWSYFASGENTHHLAFDVWRMSLPLIFRYTFLNKKMSPFVEAGPAVSYNLRENVRLYTYHRVDDNVFIQLEQPQDLIPKTQLGLTGGMGMIARQNSKHGVMLQCRVNKFYVVHHQHGSLKSNEIVLTAGILF